jgi:hypothetical protein
MATGAGFVPGVGMGMARGVTVIVGVTMTVVVALLVAVRMVVIVTVVVATCVTFLMVVRVIVAACVTFLIVVRMAVIVLMLVTVVAIPPPRAIRNGAACVRVAAAAGVIIPRFLEHRFRCRRARRPGVSPVEARPKALRKPNSRPENLDHGRFLPKVTESLDSL